MNFIVYICSHAQVVIDRNDLSFNGFACLIDFYFLFKKR